MLKLIKKSIRCLMSGKEHHDEKEPVKEIRPSELGVNSDPLTNTTLGKYSMVLGDTEYEWDIVPLYDLADIGRFELIKYNIPPDFLGEWYWGDTTIDEHVDRVMKADTSYPILVWDNQIIDGTHRCCLSLATGMTSILAYNILSMPSHDREYTPKAEQRRPINQGLSHAKVIKEVQKLMQAGLNITPSPHKP